ncbi:MAG TPA: metal-dependent phosphohydrolase [Caulobacteraceae bacterium]
MTVEAAVDEVMALFGRRGLERYGEHVTQLDHALQCASLAVEDGAPTSLIAAALLHDYGHLIDDRGHMAERDGLDGQHEAVGAAALAAWFGPEVTQPIALHVEAKRYLCATEPDYFEALSPASQLSLELQGGPFTPAEAAAFAARPFAAEAVRLRRWDDWAKALEPARRRSLESFRAVLVEAARGARP